MTNRDHLDALGAKWAWKLPGGNGYCTRVCDCEFGLELKHEDLPEIAVISQRGHDLFTNRDHGTMTMGVLGALDNKWGATGVCHGADLLFASESGGFRPQCILDAILTLCCGDVLVLEMQGETPVRNLEVPAEFDREVHCASLVAAALGITVVAAAGNRRQDLATICHPQYGGLWDPDEPEFDDSLAILVGAGKPHDCTWRDDSNFGRRVNCQGWGEAVCTTLAGPLGGHHREVQCIFNSTSSATAMVAGVVACLQGRSKAKWGRPLPPQLVRTLLSHSLNGTAQPLDDWLQYPIGPLPNLEKLYRNSGLD
jgi:hypothetical protein